MSVVSKKEIVKANVKDKHGCVGAVCQRCAKVVKLIDQMHEANIPMGYWFLNMKNFQGAKKIEEIYLDYIDKLHDNYLVGKSLCFAGNQGTGKTMSSICILKQAIKGGYSVYYTTASDILNDMTDYKNNGDLRNKLRTTDFLVIDELDSRFFVSDSVKELFSGIYENIFRFRAHNTMPTIICTNETEGILNIFHGPGTQSIESLNHQYLTMCPVIGQDFRKREV